MAIASDGSEKMYFGVEDPTTASAVIDVVAGEEYPIELLVAATSISEANHGERNKCLKTYLFTVSFN